MTFKLVWRGKEVSEDARKAAVQGVKDAAEVLLDESNKLVPIDEGTLKNSGQVSVDEKDITASVSYDTPYAVRQHEDTTMRHSNGRQAKFLETAYKENQNRLQEYIARKIEDALGR